MIGENEKMKGRILIYFDESHTLYSAENGDDATPESLYDDLAHCLDYLHPHLVAVFLSTNSKLKRLAAAQPHHASARVSKNSNAALPAPFTELPFDCEWGSNCIVTQRSMTLSEITSPEFLVKFGRPLFVEDLSFPQIATLIIYYHRWYTRYIKSPQVDRGPQIVAFARDKLIGGELPLKDAFLDEPQGLAVLSVCIMLDFEPPRVVADQTEAIQVERHMRIAYSVPQHRAYMRSGTPSEPILAEAAAQLMKYVKDAPKTLADFVNKGLVDKGHAGELAARLLLTLAYHQAIRLPAPKEIYLRHSQGCKLSTFLTALLGPDNYELLSASRADDQSIGEKRTFKDYFKDARVRFTHFGRANDSKVITVKFLWAAFLRCMAVQCSVNQPSIDIIIPVLIDENRLVEESNMSGLLIQVKDKTREAHVNHLHFTATELGLFSEVKPSRPYLNILMQLGVSDKAEFEVLEPSNTSTPPSIHRRFTTNIIGCAPEVYPVVEARDVGSYNALLLSKNTLEEHPRQDPASIEAVRALKPFWDDGSYESWIRPDVGAKGVGVEEGGTNEKAIKGEGPKRKREIEGEVIV